MISPVCPTCAKTMEPGFVMDKTYGDDYSSPPEWADGTPDHSFWTGVQMKDRKRHPVATYRCPGCGYLESYAP